MKQVIVHFWALYSNCCLFGLYIYLYSLCDDTNHATLKPAIDTMEWYQKFWVLRKSQHIISQQT